MATNLIQENKALANAYGIPRLRDNEAQRSYYPHHLRRYTSLLRWVMIINAVLVAALLYLFFFSPTEPYFATSFSGKITPLTAYDTLQTASSLTQKNVSQGSNV